MSKVKFKLIEGVAKKSGCLGCCFYQAVDGKSVCNGSGKQVEKCCEERGIWVIDEPQSEWTPIEDAELMDGEDYRIYLHEADCMSIAYWSDYVGAFAYHDATEVDKCNVSHVIHLPKPQPPVK